MLILRSWFDRFTTRTSRILTLPELAGLFPASAPDADASDQARVARHFCREQAVRRAASTEEGVVLDHQTPGPPTAGVGVRGISENRLPIDIDAGSAGRSGGQPHVDVIGLARLDVVGALGFAEMLTARDIAGIGAKMRAARSPCHRP